MAVFQIGLAISSEVTLMSFFITIVSPIAITNRSS
jgi:hypothetical protein